MCWHDVCLGSLFVWNEVDTRVRNAPHASKERSPKNVCMGGYIGRKELRKWWEHVLSCSVKTCNTRSKAAHLWKKVTGSISWRNYFKTKNVWTFLALSCSLFLGKRLEMLSDEKIEKCNSFLVSLFIFCFLNIIIRRFFRDINFTLRKRVILLQQDYEFSNMYIMKRQRDPSIQW